MKGAAKYRVPDTMDISLASIKNVSAGGLCLLCKHEFEEGKIVSFEFEIAGDAKPIRADGEIRWCEKISPPTGVYSHRIGVLFTKIDDKKQNEITNFVVRRLKAQVKEQIEEIDDGTEGTTDEERSRPTILVIDDDKVVLKLVENIFQESFNVITASNGYIGIEKAKEWRPMLILLDIVMPELDGFSTLMLLKDFEETKNIPVIMLSIVRQKGKIFQALHHGADDYILKPFTVESLLRKIKKFTDSNL